MKYSQLEFLTCQECGYSFSAQNQKDYLKGVRLTSPGSVPRVGDGMVAGREFYMANGAMNILRLVREGPFSVLIFGAGLNRDHELIRRLPTVSECALTDLGNFQEHNSFVPLSGSKRRFDIVVACEVVEHFTEPRQQFGQIIRFMKPNGVIIASTNLKTKSDFSIYPYPFLYGHVSYYTGKALMFLAEQCGLYIDFRTPASKGWVTGTKRYVYMTGSDKIRRGIIERFSMVPYPRTE